VSAPEPVQLHPIFADLFYGRKAGGTNDPLVKPWRWLGYYGGRGTAKSHSIGTALPIIAAAEPLRIVCGRQFQNSLDDSAKTLIEKKIERHGIRNYRVYNNEIVNTATGSRFTFIGLDRNPNSAKSLEGCDLLWLEESQMINAYSMEVIEPTIRDAGSQILASWNPNKPTDPIDAMLRGPDPPKRSRVHHVRQEHNLWFARTEMPDQMERMRRTDPNKYRHVWLGEYRNLADSQVFKSVRVARLEVPDKARPLHGLDFGFATDPSAGVVVYILNGGRTLYIAHELVAHGIPTAAMPAWLDGLPLSRKFPIVADSSRPETIDHLNRNGFTARGAKKGANSVNDGVEWIKGLEIVISPDCPHAAKEFQDYSYQVDRMTQKVLPVLEDGNDHVIDAVRYATEDERRGGIVINGRRV
jgi:phage terminase large subunit